MFVRCHAIETDFTNQTTAAAIVIVPASKPTKAIVGNLTNSIVLLRDGPHHRIQNAHCVRVVRSGGKMVADAVGIEPVSLPHSRSTAKTWNFTHLIPSGGSTQADSMSKFNHFVPISRAG